MAAGDSLRVAVRPERVQLGPLDGAVSGGGSRLEGTVEEVIYLGMYNQYHVETAAGRVLCHRVEEPAAPPLEPGSRVTVSWDADDTAILG